MDGVLDLCGQKWKQKQAGELRFHLHYEPLRAGELYFSMDCSFVPPWLEEGDRESAHRTLNLEVSASVPIHDDWRELSGKRIEARGEEVFLGTLLLPDFTAPQIRLYSFGHGPIYTHADELWNSNITFGDVEGDSYEMSFRVEAFCPSERARDANQREMEKELRRWFQQVAEGEEETEARIFQGWQLCYTGMVRFDQMLCVTPLNSSKPVAMAKELARKTINQTEFGLSRVNGGNLYDESFQPEQGLTWGGRLVVLDTPSEYYRRWVTGQKPAGA